MTTEALNQQEIKAKYRFLCRRGMLELDRILLKFFITYYDTLTDQEIKQFGALLNCEDQMLWDYLVVKNKPLPVAFKDIGVLIKCF